MEMSCRPVGFCALYLNKVTLWLGTVISWMTLLTRRCVSAQETPARGESGADNEVQLARCLPATVEPTC